MPFTRLTLEERIRCVKLYYMYDKTTKIQKAWRKEFGSDPPSRKTIAAVNKKFLETGSVADLSRSGRPKTSRTEQTVSMVQEALKNDPTKSIRTLSTELGVNKAAVHRIKQDTEKKKSTLKLENKKLKERVVELTRKLAQLEAKSSCSVTQSDTFDLDLKHVSSDQMIEAGTTHTIICSGEGDPLTTYTVQVVTPAVVLNQQAQIAQDQLERVQLSVKDDYPMFLSRSE